MWAIVKKAKNEIPFLLPDFGKRKELTRFLKQLQDLCRDAKEQKHMTAQDISDASGVPVSTINNFFASSSRLPSIGTAGPICKVLGVSMDSYYGIAPSEQELQAETDTLRSQLHDLELENVRLTERVSTMEQQQKNNHRIVLVQSAFISVLVAALLAYLVIDANIRTDGLIVHGQPGAVACALMALAAVSVAVIIVSIIQAVRNKKK